MGIATDKPIEGAAELDAIPSAVALVGALFRARSMIVNCAVGGLLLGVAAALMRPAMYVSSFSFLPYAATGTTIGGLASIAGELGVSVGNVGGGADSPLLYPEIISARALLLPIVRESTPVVGESSRQLPLSEFFGIQEDDSALAEEEVLRTLREEVIATRVAARTTGLVSVAVKTEDPLVSHIIAQRLLDGVNHFNAVARQSHARQERVFAQSRYEDARTHLNAAEDALMEFLTRNREYSNSPRLVFSKERLEREVSLDLQLVGALASQYEDARMREVRDVPVITVIEAPVVPVVPAPRLRVLLSLLGGLFGACFGSCVVLLRWHFLPQMRRDAAWHSLVGEWKAFSARIPRWH